MEKYDPIKPTIPRQTHDQVISGSGSFSIGLKDVKAAMPVGGVFK